MLVYSYHVYRKHMKAEDLKVCEEQFELNHEYKIQCLKIQRKRLNADREALRTPEIDEIQAKLLPLRERLNILWTEARKVRKSEREKTLPEVMAEIDRLSGERKPLFEELYQEYKKSRKTEQYKALKASLHKEYLSETRINRATWSDRIHYASRGLAEAAAEQSFSKAITSGSRICIEQYQGFGIIGGQVKPHGDQWDLLRIPPIQHPLRPSGKPKKVYATLSLKIGGVDSAKRWVELPCAIHRPLPDASIKEVRLCREMEDGQPIYTLRLTIDVDKVLSNSELCMGINFGWRQTEAGGLRVAAWQGEDGESGVVELPEAVRQKWGKSSELKALRAQRFNEFRERLKELAPDEPVHLWQSIENVHTLRKKLGEDAPADLIEWVRRDRHLGHYEFGCRRNAVLLRREIYRVFAARMSEKYRYVIIEADIKDDKKAINLKYVQQRSVAASTNSVLASLSEFRQILENAGMIAVPTDRRHTSSTHHGCGGTIDLKKPEIELHCMQCGEVIDRDLNAALNILSRGKDAAQEAAKTRQEKIQTAQTRKSERLSHRLAARKKNKENSQTDTVPSEQ
jgi:hypothetical protein